MCVTLLRLPGSVRQRRLRRCGCGPRESWLVDGWGDVFYRLFDVHVRMLLDMTREHVAHNSADPRTVRSEGVS